MLSLTHLLLLAFVLLLLFGKNKIPDIGRSLGDSARNFKKALRGEEDIDVTDSVKRIEDDQSPRE
jgi:sec-independent protein translocase protein TatA